jgi:hypothetical protein
MYYNDDTGNSNVAFICVSHDGWDSKQNDILGVSILFIIPYSWTAVSMPIGLKYMQSKKAGDVVTQLNEILRRYKLYL